MKKIKFKELFKFAPKSKTKARDGSNEGEYPFYTSSLIVSKKTNKAQYYDESLIFGTGGSASIHYANEPFSTSTDCVVAVPISKILKTKFVYYYLFKNIHILEKGFKGAGLKHISKNYIENIEVPIFSIEIQNKIISILDKASILLTNRQKSILLSQQLLNSLFLDMFKNIASWEKNNTTKPLGDYITIKHGYAFKSKYFSDEGEYVLLTPGNFYESGGYRNKGLKQKYYSGVIPDGFILSKNDLLIAMTEQSPGLLGSPLFVPESNHFLHNQRLGLVKFKDQKINIKFLFYFFNTGIVRAIISAKANGIKVRHISPQKIEEIEISLPDYRTQELFDKYASHIEINLHKQINSLELIKHLYNSILQKAFNGELSFNIDAELDALIKTIDLEKKENDLSKITSDISYLQRLIDKLNHNEFLSKDLYDRAKHAVFQLLKENDKVVQLYDSNILLALK